MEKQDFLIAAIMDNREFLEEWLVDDDNTNMTFLNEVLLKAAEYGSFSVVELLSALECVNVNEQLQVREDASHSDLKKDGWTALHFAVNGYEKEAVDMTKQENDLMLTIFELVKNGANPTIKSACGQQPKHLALIVGFELGILLLDLCERAWISEHQDGDANETSVVEIKWLIKAKKLPQLYKKLACWSFKTGKCQIFKWILKLVNDPKITQYCLKITEDDGILGSLYHSAASADSPAALELLLKYCSPAKIINIRHTVDGNNSVTPLSLILSHGHVKHIKLLIDYNLNHANTQHLVEINLSDTKVEEFSLSVLHFSSVETLILDNTGLKALKRDGILPMPDIKKLQLEDFCASHNQLTELPSDLFTFPKLKKLNVSYNQIDNLPDNWWQGPVLECLNVSHNVLEELPLSDSLEQEDEEPDLNRHSLCGRSELVFNDLPKIPTHYGVTTQENFFSPLQKLMLNNNHIRTFPTYLSCCVPLLQTLDLSYNWLTKVASINEIPLSLESLNVSHNHLGAEDCTIFSVSFERRPCAAVLFHEDKHYKCHHRSHTTLPVLHALYLNNNEDLKEFFVHSKLPTVDADAIFLPGKDIKIHLFFPHLYRLDVSYCSLTELPKYFSRMNLLSELKISGNTNLKIAAEICLLRKMFVFEYKDINDDEIVPKLNQFQTVKDKLEFLNPLYGDKKDCFPPTVKLVFLGTKGQGRSTLLSYLKLTKLSPASSCASNQSLFYLDLDAKPQIAKSGSLNIDLWNCDYTDSHKLHKTISFCIWDFSGDKTCIQQCFFTPSAIYVICFKATDGVRGVVELEDWLLAIKARAPMSKVVIVATHNDQLSKKSKEQDSINEAIERLYKRKSTVYPEISSVKFVECHEGKKDFSDISTLTHTLSHIATKIQASATHRVGLRVKLMQRYVPKGFLDLQEQFVAQWIANSDRRKEGAHILTWGELKKILKERLMYLVPSTVHFMDETFMTEIIKDAVTHLIITGTLIHYNSPGLSDLYFVDPPWLYDLLSSVLTTKYCISEDWDQGGKRNGKLDMIQLEQILLERGLLPEYVGLFIKLLCNFEIAVPLDANTLLIPSLIDGEANKHSQAVVKYIFPRKDVKKHLSKDINIQGSTFKRMPVITGKIHTSKQLMLHPTGVCYRRIVLLHHIPISFWPRLLARCLSSASFFYKIILGNCVPDMPFQRLANPGDVVIGHIPCQWFYWKNGIMLDFDNRTLLFVSNLINPNVVDENGNRQASSPTVEKIRKMGLCTTGKDWQQSFSMFNNGFEINVPDYMLESRSTNPRGPKRVSSLLSVQIMNHVLEITDEVLREWFEGDSGLYSDDSTVIHQFIPCPHCFGDEKTPEEKQIKEEDNFNIELNEIPVDISPSSNLRRRAVTIAGTSPVMEVKVPNSLSNKALSCPEEQTDLFKGFCDRKRRNGMQRNISWNLGTDASAGFTFKHCILATDNVGDIMCPFHDALKLSDLIPDVMFRDMLHSTIDKSALRGKHKLLGQGGFGTVYRVKFYKEETGTFENVVVKIPNNKEDMVDSYANIRLELNKLCYSTHKYIVQFIGITMDPLSFVMEYAPLGSFRKILKVYREAKCSLCPVSILLSIQQISYALDFLHQEKSIVHFDLKPDNVLVFQFPPHTHQCYVQGRPMKSVSCVYCKESSDNPGVLVKLADLGISAVIGPGGFSRKQATPGHTAPEALKHLGKEQMTEKVDIFSLGVSLYELMTLRELPPDSGTLLFDEEIKEGRRPQFISVDPKYPQILYDCLVSCWAQKYFNRPSAEELTKHMQLDNLSLVNSYSLGDLQVTDVLAVTAEDGNTSLWIASNLIRQNIEEHVLSVYTVVDSESGPSFKMDVYRTTLKSCIQSLCQVDEKYVWIACEDDSVAICLIETFSILKYCSFKELKEHGQSLRGMLTIADSLVVLGYYHGMLAFIENNDSLLDTEGNSMIYSIMSGIQTTCLVNIGCLNTLESFEKDGGQQVIWCGCDKGIIYVVESLSTWRETFKDHQMKDLTKTPLKVDSVSDKLDSKLDIVQLKSVSSASMGKVVVYALHGDCDNSTSVISCWFTDQTLHRIINLQNPAITILPQSTGVYVVEYDGKLYIFDSDGDRTPLPGYHNPLPGYHNSTTVYLTSMHASITLNGFVSSIGHQQDPSTNNIQCRMLISVGRGCDGPLQQHSQPSTTKLDSTYAILHSIPL